VTPPEGWPRLLTLPEDGPRRLTPPGGWRRLLREVPGALGRLLGRRAAGPVRDPLPPWWHWRHVTKLDPDRPLGDAALAAVLASGTDAILVGGTQGITGAKVLRLLNRLEGSPVPVALEVSEPEAAIPGVGLYFIPLLLNSREDRWLMAPQAVAMGRLLPRYGALIPWERMWPSAYLVLNPEAAVARRTDAIPLGAAEAAGCAAVVGRIWRLPLFYLEYSGRFGDPDLVRRVKAAAGPGCRVWYGGGIRSPEQAAAMARVADTVVVGNLAHLEPERLAATVQAVRSVPPPG